MFVYVRKLEPSSSKAYCGAPICRVRGHGIAAARCCAAPQEGSFIGAQDRRTPTITRAPSAQHGITHPSYLRVACIVLFGITPCENLKADEHHDPRLARHGTPEMLRMR